MRKTKYFIILVLLFICIGFASLSVTLSINGKANVISDLDDFKVYFSDVIVNGEQDLSLVKSDKELVFNALMKNVGDEYKIEYQVTNGSSVFDAALNVTCTQGDQLLSITNQFDTSTNLNAKSSRQGTLTLKKALTNVNEIDDYYPISCKITASAVDRTSSDNGNIVGPLNAYKYAVGTEIELSGVKFNVISVDGDSLSLLSQKYFRTTGDFDLIGDEISLVVFSSDSYWDYLPGAKEIDVSNSSYISAYFRYNKSLFIDVLGRENFSWDLISLKELRNLGCTISNDYSEKNNLSCANSPYADWLVSDVSWWTKSASSSNQNNVWVVGENGVLTAVDCSTSNAIRPVIRTTITALENDILPFKINGKTYYTGKNVTWSEWVNTDYNVDGYVSKSSGIFSAEGYLVFGVETNDIVYYNGDHKLSYLFTTNVVIEETGEIIYSRTFHTYINSTWREWMNSDLNNGYLELSSDGYVVIDGYKSSFRADDVIEEDGLYEVLV